MTRLSQQNGPALRRRPSRWFALAMATLLCGLMPMSGLATSLQVAPISVELEHDRNAETLWLSNTGDVPVQAQVRVMKWSQDGGADTLEPSRELLPSPPIVEILPGERQLVRIVRPDASEVAKEQAFRLLVDELPNAEQSSSAGLQFLLQYSIPVFVLPPGATPQHAPGPRPPTDTSALSARLESGNEGAMLTVVNRGDRRVRLSALASIDGSSSAGTMLVPGLLGYVLAGQRMQWPLGVPAEELRGHSFKVRLNDDQESQLLPFTSTP